MRTGLLLSLLLFSVSATAQTYTESIIYNFGSSSPDGEYPVGGLVMDHAGNLYGTTSEGSIANNNCSQGFQVGCGTVFKLSSTGLETLLHIFTGGTDGDYPLASLAIDKSGNLYGTTVFGGLGCGTVFKITPAGKYSVLHRFGRKSGDGCFPYGPLTLDSAGNMYGTTFEGGSTAGECGANGLQGCGTIFEINSTGQESVLYAFTYGGSSLPQGNVLRDSKGNFYSLGNDVLFELTSTKTLVTLYDFSGLGLESIGYSNAYIARDATGNFYGIAINLSGPNEGLWQVTANSVEGTYYLCDSCSVSSPSGDEYNGPLMVASGNLYGTTYSGGPAEAGVVYEFSPSSGLETVLYSFGGSNSPDDGCGPEGGVISDAAGNLYGTTLFCGTHSSGTVFKLTKN